MHHPELRLNDLVDESGRPFFEREQALEQAFLALRAERSARTTTSSARQCDGTLVVFPTVVFGPYLNHSGCGAAGQWPVQLSAEPGSLFPRGVSDVHWQVNVGTYQISGVFHIAVDTDHEPPAARCWLEQRGEPAPLPSPYRSIAVPLHHARIVQREYRRLTEQAAAGRASLVEHTDRLIRRIVGRFSGRFVAAYDADDAYQDVVTAVVGPLADRFASARRPAAAWGRVVAMEANKLVSRALAHHLGVGRPEQAVRQLLAERPDLANAAIPDVRSALRSVSSEADTWSDRRIASAVGGPPVLVALDACPEPTALDRSDIDSPDELLETLMPDPTRRAQVAPWVASEGLAAISADAPPWAVSRAKRAFISELARRLGVQAISARQLAEAFAAPGESYDIPTQRALMVERARNAIIRHLSDTGAKRA